MSKKAAPSPFPTAVKRHGKPEIDPSLMKLEFDTPIPSRRPPTGSKYAPLFGKLKPGACIVCEAHEAPTVANVLSKQMAAKSLPKLAGCRIVFRKKCDDGHARVWVLKDDPER